LRDLKFIGSFLLAQYLIVVLNARTMLVIFKPFLVESAKCLFVSFILVLRLKLALLVYS